LIVKLLLRFFATQKKKSFNNLTISVAKQPDNSSRFVIYLNYSLSKLRKLLIFKDLKANNDIFLKILELLPTFSIKMTLYILKSKQLQNYSLSTGAGQIFSLPRTDDFSRRRTTKLLTAKVVSTVPFQNKIKICPAPLSTPMSHNTNQNFLLAISLT